MGLLLGASIVTVFEILDLILFQCGRRKKSMDNGNV